MILRALPAFVFGFIATANAVEVVIADRVIDEPVAPNPPAPAPAEAAKTTLKADGVPKNKFTARDVEVRISDGSLIRGQLKNTDTIALKTDYGRLVYPIGDIVKINVGRRLSAEQTREIDLAVTNLDSDDFDKRSAAQMTLESMGENAVLPLQAALKTAGTEAKSRIEKILRKTQSKASKAQIEDSVRTQKFDITGMLEAKSFILATKLGDLMIKVEDITHIRWLSGCVSKKLSLAATDGLKDWCDTGVDVIRGDSIGFQCTGEINLFGSCNTGPTGTTNWNGRPYLVGAMIGRVGDSGIPFLIGPGRRVQASGSDRLYVKMYCPEDFFNGDNLNRSSGSFEIHVATGRSAEDMIVPDSGE